MILIGWVGPDSLGNAPMVDALTYGALISATDTVGTISVFAGAWRFRRPQPAALWASQSVSCHSRP